MTQCERVLRHMQQRGSIDPREALEAYGIMRLGARIWDLKRVGCKIRRETVQDVNRFGEPVRFTRYSLEDETV